MKFIDRTGEMNLLKEAKSLSAKKLYSVLIYGLRRVGKTRLILEFMDNDDLYFFVNKDKTSESLLREYEEGLRKGGIITELERLESWDSFFQVLFERYKGTVAFDEFQNFLDVDKAVFGTLQKYMDINENRKGLLFIFSGSTIGLIKKLFLDSKEPLYGRVKRRLHLRPMNFFNTFKMCREANVTNMEDIIKLYSIFGGLPRYYVAIEDENLKGKNFEDIIEKFFFVENALFEDEVKTVLSLEFGRRSGLYYDILAAVANGCTRISEIASFLRKKETSITRQLNELIHYFEIIAVEKQAVGRKKGMYIEHPLINFWFRHFYKNLSDYKKRDASFVRKTKNELTTYIGHRFEVMCRETLQVIVPFEYEKIGRQWGKIPDKPKAENQYEIDIVALNEDTKEILFGECKWKGKVNAERIVKRLDKKAEYVQWNNDSRKEQFAVFAKSFSNKIDEFEGKTVHCIDLKGLEKALLINTGASNYKT